MSAGALDDLYVFILAGGSGERFWPLSRTAKPKHLLRLLGDRTLLEETVLRVADLVPRERILILTNQAQRGGCLEAVPSLAPSAFIAEPAKRDTAPAAALATGFARARNPNAKCLLLPADAWIADAATFRRNVRDAAAAAVLEDSLLTFAIPPRYAATGFGYLELGESLGRGPEKTAFQAVKRFVEKPDADTADDYLQRGNFAWNAGMFLWRAETFLSACREFVPPLAEFIEQFPDGNPAPYLDRVFKELPKISVDYAVMEKATGVAAVRAEFDWDDVGAWTALPDHLGRDRRDNTVRGPAAMVDAHNNIVFSQGRVIALCGVSDLVVVETPDAVLVAHRNAVQQIKNLQPKLPDTLR